jgi:hypothetical protein
MLPAPLVFGKKPPVRAVVGQIHGGISDVDIGGVTDSEAEV